MLTVTERRRLAFKLEDIYALVADVAHYPEFIPGILTASVSPQTPDRFRADLLVGYQFFRERYACYVNLFPGERIEIEYVEGPFSTLQNTWYFMPTNAGVIVDFFMAFEFRSQFLQTTIGRMMPQLVDKMITSFENRATKIYPRAFLIS